MTTDKKINVLLLGSGGRESALAYKIAQSPLLDKLYIAPGNAGTGAYGTNLAVSATDFETIRKILKEKSVSLVVVGPEEPLVKGVRTALKDVQGPDGKPVAIVGPDTDGAALEGSKDFAKGFMNCHGIPTARHLTVTESNINEGFEFLKTLKAPYVLKADGLAAGKGVLIVNTLEEAETELRSMLDGAFGAASSKVVIEEFLSGIECSVFILTDGTGRYLLLPPAKDYKRIGEGDTGLNTGGMGAVCPPPFADRTFMDKVEERIVRPTLKGLLDEGIDYRGFIFLGLIEVNGEPMVIEYNARMGDPETEAVMPRISSDLLPVLMGMAEGNMEHCTLDIDPRVSVTVMCVSGGYPGAYKKGLPVTVTNIPEGTEVFHAGTVLDSESVILTSGGRVIAVTSLAPTLQEAAQLSFKAAEGIEFEGKYYRHDIAADMIALSK